MNLLHQLNPLSPIYIGKNNSAHIEVIGNSDFLIIGLVFILMIGAGIIIYDAYKN